MDGCKDVTCERGVCNPSTKACANAASCSDDNACLAGFACNEGVCRAEFECSDTLPCARGACTDGVCQNAEVCAVEANCVPGYYCSADGSCQQNPCQNISCPRGQCTPSTGQCANAPTCTRATEGSDCLADNYCFAQNCVSAEALCTELNCPAGRGVCDPSLRACVNATDCEGSDRNCISGQFCNEINRCQQNLCNATSGQCARGVCEPGTGSCVNAPTCSGPSGCIDNFMCIGGSCQASAEACVECTGNQVCNFEPSSLSVSCAESAQGCLNGLGCLGERVCRDGRCAAPTACVPDAYEPNNSLADAANLKQALVSGPIAATLCAADVDFFSFDTRGLGLTRGTLVAELRVRSSDVGNGNVEVIVRNGVGTVMATGADANTGIITLEIALNAAQLGVYTIEVRDSGNITSAGLRYTLFADFVGASTVAACADNVADLAPGVINANSLDGQTYEMGSSCTSATNTARENIYRIELDTRSYVHLVVKPAAGVELTMSLRQSCLSRLSEIDCANLGGRGQTERLGLALDAGTYYLVVKGPAQNTGGAYTLEYTREAILCPAGVSYCADALTASLCNARGTGYQPMHCEHGCVAGGGFCAGEPGDTCQLAIDATQGYSGEIDWLALKNSYDPGVDSCVPNNTDGARTGGPDQVFVVNVGPGHALQADLSTTIDYGSLYMVEDCLDLANSCVGAVSQASPIQGGAQRKTLVWQNPSTETRRIFVIADAGKNWGGRATINISTGPVVCGAAESRCVGDDLEVCNVSQTAFETSRTCYFGCNANGSPQRCNPALNQVCKGALDIVGIGGSFSGMIDDYTNNYNPGRRGCTEREGTGNGAATGGDALFYVDADEGDVITAIVHADFDAVLWVTTDCSNAAQSCVAGSNQNVLTPEVLHFAAPHSGRYYIIVDSKVLAESGAFRLDVTVDLPMCPPGNLIGCSDTQTLTYCGPLGAPMPHRCDTTCTGSACDQPNGDVCHDAIRVFNGDVIANTFKGRNTLRPGSGNVGECSFPSGELFGSEGPIGADTIYAVALTAGQILNVTGHTQNLNADGVFYLLEDCANAQSCLDASEPNTHPDLVYVASEDKTIFIVASRVREGAHASGYTLNINVIDPECEPGERTCSDTSTMRICNSLHHFEFHGCTSSCQAGRCTVPTGDVCADPIQLRHLDRVEGNFLGTNSVNPGQKSPGQCSFNDDRFEAGAGPDTIYSIEMRAGQRLIANVRSASTQVLVYILEDCTRTTTCLANSLRSDVHSLEYVADVDKTVYVVVDLSALIGNTNATYELSIDLQFAGCTPGEVSCQADAKTLGVCGDDAFFALYPCTSTCSAGACDERRGGICADSISLRSGQQVSGNFSNDSHLSLDPHDSGACTFAAILETDERARHGADTIYTIEMAAGELLTARLDSRSDRAFMYLRDGCGQGSSTCLETTLPAMFSELNYVAEVDKTVTLVVTRSTAGRSNLVFELEVFLQTPGCFDGEVSCLADGVSLGVCTPEGHFTPYICEDGCLDGACETPRGDFCQDALEMFGGDTIIGNWMGLPTLNPGTGTFGACNLGTPGALGRETIYALNVPVGQVMRAELIPDTTSSTIRNNAIMYLMEDCADTASCLANTAPGSDTLFYASTEEKTVYLVVDYRADARPTVNYALTVTFETPDCMPGTYQCNSQGTSLQSCGASGVYSNIGCSSDSCTDGKCDDPSGLVCHEPIVAQSGDFLTGDWTAARGNNINPGSGTVGQCAFGTFQAQGNDTVYAVDLKAGEVLVVKMLKTATSWIVYVMEDCTNPSSCLASTRVDTELFYVADRDKTVHVVVDRTVTGASATTWEMQIDVLPQDCTPDARRCAGDTLQVCNNLNIWRDYECEGGCAAGQCLVPQGQSCPTAILATPGPTIHQGNWQGTAILNPGTGTVGQCAFGTAQAAGQDTIYAVPVKAGEILRAELTTNLTNAVMYLLGSCTNVSSCLGRTPALSGSTLQTVNLIHEVIEDGTLFLVVDRATATNVSNTYELTVRMDVPCQVGHQRCSSDSARLEVCDSTGTYSSYACDGNSCSSAACTDPTGDFCQDAVALQSGDRRNGVLSGLNTIDPGAGDVGSCSFSNTSHGREHIFALSMTTGDVLSVFLNSSNSGTRLYLLEDCTNTETCLANTLNSRVHELHYVSDKDQTIFLVVDDSATSLTVTYDMSVRIQEANTCVAGQTRCDGDYLDVCTSLAIWKNTYECTDGCFEGRCNTPRGDICHDAIAISSGYSLVHAYDGMSNELFPGTDTCFYAANQNFPGRDRVFSIELNRGDLLDVEFISTNTGQLNNSGIYVLDNCVGAEADTCLYGEKGGTMQFYAPRTQTYFLVIDATNDGLNLELSVLVRPNAAVCQPGNSTCDPVDGVLTMCNARGTAVEGYAQCEFGCDRRFCAGPPAPNDTCPDAVVIDGKTRIFDTWERFVSSYNPGTSSCTNLATAGPDAAYKVSLAPGEVFKANVLATHTVHRPVLYLVRDCASITTSCVAAGVSTLANASLEYLSIAGGDYFLLVDTTTASHTGPFILDVDFQPSECTIGDKRCGINDLELCGPVGLWLPQNCPFGCANQACLPATNDTCAQAYDATGGLDITFDMDSYTNQMNSGDTTGLPCTSGEPTRGTDAVFFVDVDKNDVIIVDAKANFGDVALWITTSCATAASSCVAGVYGSSSAQFLTYRAPAAGRYFVVMDTWMSSVTPRQFNGPVNLSISVSPPSCEAFEISCIDADTLQYCRDNGSGYIDYTCQDGCNEGTCGTPRGGICPDAIDATGGGTFTGNFATFPNTSDPGFGGCTGFEAPGPDAVYAIGLNAGQSMTATLSNVSANNDLSLYVVASCFHVRDTCMVGSDAYGTVPETLTYTASQSEMVYVVADTWNANATGQFQLMIVVQ
ncbi:MAG: hypothetical protein H0U74_12070 [Bradymonadaceae bacterium]|nr:hypothetical protein [Lujinxingiaceae bacterium]